MPTVAQRIGDFSAQNPAPVTCADAGAICDPGTGLPFPGNMIPLLSLDPVAVAVRDELIPPPNQGTNQFVSSPVTSNDNDQFTVRVDHSFSEKNYLSARYHLIDGSNLRFFTNTLFNIPIQTPDFPLADEFRVQNLAVSDTHSFSSSLINEARFGFNRGVFHSALPQNPRDPA